MQQNTSSSSSSWSSWSSSSLLSIYNSVPENYHHRRRRRRRRRPPPPPPPPPPPHHHHQCPKTITDHSNFRYRLGSCGLLDYDQKQYMCVQRHETSHALCSGHGWVPEDKDQLFNFSMSNLVQSFKRSEITYCRNGHDGEDIANSVRYPQSLDSLWQWYDYGNAVILLCRSEPRLGWQYRFDYVLWCQKGSSKHLSELLASNLIGFPTFMITMPWPVH